MLPKLNEFRHLMVRIVQLIAITSPSLVAGGVVDLAQQALRVAFSSVLPTQDGPLHFRL
jgi:hypothetical protein